jgi:hypothetical protein
MKNFAFASWNNSLCPCGHWDITHIHSVLETNQPSAFIPVCSAVSRIDPKSDFGESILYMLLSSSCFVIKLQCSALWEPATESVCSTNQI